MADATRFLGITVMSPYFQFEGVEAVISNLVGRAGATAVACNTSVTEPAAEGEGSFQPPIDAGASVRLLDRPLWGKTSLWLRSAPGHHANQAAYQDSPYKPRAAGPLTDTAGPIIGEFLQAAKQAGLRTYIQTGAAQPPGMLDDDVPCLPDGSPCLDRLANTACLASPAVRAYNRAWVRDILDTYPEIDGIRPDWPEYPCYKLDEAFQDFNSHLKIWANERGFDFESIRRDVARFYAYLHGELKNEDLQDFASPDRGKFTLTHLFNRFPGVHAWFRMKAALSNDFLHAWRSALDDFAGADKELSANAFMSPFSFFTGLDFAGAAEYCASISPKLYTMHWSLIVKFWGQVLLQSNHDLDESLLTRALVNLLDLSDQVGDVTLSDYGYPAPDEPHPIPNGPQIRKLNQVLSATGGRAKIYALVHGYGPLDDFSRRLQLVADSEVDGVWINRYGYLSNEKLDAIRAIWHT